MAEEQAQPSMDEVIAQQKAQCPFCKIITGEISSIKVHEDDKILAIMDINPATAGHILLMPKEHYPIMPLIPRDIFEHMFTISTYLLRAIKKACIVPNASIFIANGGIAGQQSAHFMVHLLPREAGNGLDFLDAIGKNTETGSDIKQTLASHVPGALLRFSEEHPSVKDFLITEKTTSNPDVNEQAPPTATSAQQKDQISQLYESNPQFKELILHHPDKLKELLNTDQKLAALFTGINVDALSAKLKEMEGKK